jgi:hypothetical protein
MQQGEPLACFIHLILKLVQCRDWTRKGPVCQFARITMKRSTIAIAAGLLAALPVAAQAKHSHRSGEHHHPHAAHLRYGPKPLGYWRPGPERGHGFAFSTYRHDPFGTDDYWDGRGCFYLHHRDFCRPYRWYEMLP